MAKRFTDTQKWSKRFIRTLKPNYKLLWLFITDECDASGIWEADLEVAQIKLGVKLTEKDALNFFAQKIVLLDNGQKWFIPSFIEFQYGQLSDQNRAHTKIISTLKKFFLLNDDLTLKPLTSPLQAPYVGAMEREKVEEGEMEQEMVMEEGGEIPKDDPPEKITMPDGFTEFPQAWEVWKDYKQEAFKFRYKTKKSEQAAINHLVTLGKGDEQDCIYIIHYAIGRQWEGLYLPDELKNKNHVKGTSKNNTGRANAANWQQLANDLAKRTGNTDNAPEYDNRS